MSTQRRSRQAHHLYQSWARAISFVLALGFSLLLLIYPQALAVEGEDVAKGPFYILMFGISAGFVHGVGFIPRHRLWRIAFGPAVAWPLLFGGLLWLLFNI